MGRWGECSPAARVQFDWSWPYENAAMVSGQQERLGELDLLLCSDSLSPALCVRKDANALDTVVLLHAILKTLAFDANPSAKAHGLTEGRCCLWVVPEVCYIKGSLAVHVFGIKISSCFYERPNSTSGAIRCGPM